MRTLPLQSGTLAPTSRYATLFRIARHLVLLLLPVALLLSCSSTLSSNAATWLGVDIIDTIRRADPIGKLCLMVLLGFSLVSWAIIIYKFLHIRAALGQTAKFVTECMAGSGNLEDAYRDAARYPDSPLAQILREGYLELEIEDWYKLGYNLSEEQRVDVARAGIERVLERTISNEMAHLESYLIFLAVATNVCPFIGLFGTVWGIMVTFQGMAHEGQAVLSALAPGIATALTTTVAGLAVAIPASVMYNYYTEKVRVLVSRMDSFSLELSNIIQKQLLKHEV